MLLSLWELFNKNYVGGRRTSFFDAIVKNILLYFAVKHDGFVNNAQKIHVKFVIANDCNVKEIVV